VSRGTIVKVIWLWVIALVVIIGVIAVVVAGRDDALVEVYDDRPDATLPTGRPLTAEDVSAVRLSTAVRGYRMDEVDALLGRIQADLLAREDSDAVKVRRQARDDSADAEVSGTSSGGATAAKPPPA